MFLPRSRASRSHLQFCGLEIYDECLHHNPASHVAEADELEKLSDIALPIGSSKAIRRTRTSTKVIVLALTTLFLSGGIWLRWWQIACLKKTLEAAKASYALADQNAILSETEMHLRGSRQRLSERSWLGKLCNLAAPGISQVRIVKGNLGDGQLHFVDHLHEVERLDLRSDQATDSTLERISRLPNLRYLTIVGKRISVRGLLKLRSARELSQVRFVARDYTPIERAVLKAELAGVAFLDLQTRPHRQSDAECLSANELEGAKTLALIGEVAF